MQNRAAIEQEHCNACRCLLQSSAQSTCYNCGYPMQGTQEEQQQFLIYREVSKTDFETHQKHVNSARNMLLWMAVISFLPVPLILATGAHGNSLMFALIRCGVMAASFLGLAVWSINRRTAALITGLCLYVGIVIISGAIHPPGIKPDLLGGVIIVFCLANGVHSSLKADKLVKQYKFS
jgi:hypothetical protein